MTVSLNQFIAIIIVEAFFVFIVILLILISTFRRMRLFTFYLFFERRFVPILFLILGWGYQGMNTPHRIPLGSKYSPQDPVFKYPYSNGNYGVALLPVSAASSSPRMPPRFQIQFPQLAGFRCLRTRGPSMGCSAWYYRPGHGDGVACERRGPQTVWRSKKLHRNGKTTVTRLISPQHCYLSHGSSNGCSRGNQNSHPIK